MKARIALLKAARVLLWLIILAVLVGLLMALGVYLNVAVGQMVIDIPLLLNGGFEGGWTRQTAYWTPEGGPFHTEFGEIFSPAGWTSWWREGFPCSGAATFQAGRPEIGLINPTVDAARVHSGNQAAKLFTFWRCHDGGFRQDVPATPGAAYVARVYAHSWYSSCDLYPHNGQPLEGDCVMPLTWAHLWLSVGIDPLGGEDPLAPSVAWGQAREIYGGYDGPLPSPRVVAQRDKITVFLRSHADNPLKHSDSYFDDAALYRADYQLFLPLFGR